MEIKFFSNNLKTIIDLKKEYKELIFQYHPDIIGGNGEEMKIINAEYDYLLKHIQKENKEDEKINVNDNFKEVLNKLIKYNLTLEIVGSWLWISGKDTFNLKDNLFKELNIFYSRGKKKFFYNGQDSKNYGYYKKKSFNTLKKEYGYKKVEGRKEKELLLSR